MITIFKNLSHFWSLRTLKPGYKLQILGPKIWPTTFARGKNFGDVFFDVFRWAEQDSENRMSIYFSGDKILDIFAFVDFVCPRLYDWRLGSDLILEPEWQLFHGSLGDGGPRYHSVWPGLMIFIWIVTLDSVRQHGLNQRYIQVARPLPPTAWTLIFTQLPSPCQHICTMMAKGACHWDRKWLAREEQYVVDICSRCQRCVSTISGAYVSSFAYFILSWFCPTLPGCHRTLTLTMQNICLRRYPPPNLTLF